MTHVTLSAEDRAHERDPWKDSPKPPVSKEAADAAELLKVAKAEPKKTRRLVTPSRQTGAR